MSEDDAPVNEVIADEKRTEANTPVEDSEHVGDDPGAEEPEERAPRISFREFSSIVNVKLTVVEGFLEQYLDGALYSVSLEVGPHSHETPQALPSVDESLIWNSTMKLTGIDNAESATVRAKVLYEGTDLTGGGCELPLLKVVKDQCIDIDGLGTIKMENQVVRWENKKTLDVNIARAQFRTSQDASEERTFLFDVQAGPVQDVISGLSAKKIEQEPDESIVADETGEAGAHDLWELDLGQGRELQMNIRGVEDDSKFIITVVTSLPHAAADNERGVNEDEEDDDGFEAKEEEIGKYEALLSDLGALDNPDGVEIEVTDMLEGNRVIGSMIICCSMKDEAVNPDDAEEGNELDEAADLIPQPPKDKKDKEGHKRTRFVLKERTHEYPPDHIAETAKKTLDKIQDDIKNQFQELMEKVKEDGKKTKKPKKKSKSAKPKPLPVHRVPRLKLLEMNWDQNMTPSGPIVRPYDSVRDPFCHSTYASRERNKILAKVMRTERSFKNPSNSIAEASVSFAPDDYDDEYLQSLTAKLDSRNEQVAAAARHLLEDIAKRCTDPMTSRIFRHTPGEKLLWQMCPMWVTGYHKCDGHVPPPGLQL